MKHIPSEETEEINYKNEKHPWFNVFVLVAGAMAAYVVLIVILGFLGEIVAVKIPARYESSLFSKMDFKMGQKKWEAGKYARG